MGRYKNEAPEPWERQEGESTQAFEAFAAYRDMKKRSLNRVAQKLGKSRVLMDRWSSVYKWQDRVKAWEAEQDRLAREKQLDAIIRMRKRHAKLATEMLDKAARALQQIPEDEIKAGDISRMVDTASKLERISRGDVETVVEERDGGPSIPVVQFYIPDNNRESDGEDDVSEG